MTCLDVVHLSSCTRLPARGETDLERGVRYERTVFWARLGTVCDRTTSAVQKVRTIPRSSDVYTAYELSDYAEIVRSYRNDSRTIELLPQPATAMTDRLEVCLALCAISTPKSNIASVRSSLACLLDRQ
jgi:hypothetical protein